jgi:hypothetical protein
VAIQQGHIRYTLALHSLPVAYAFINVVRDSSLRSDHAPIIMEPNFQSVTPNVEDSDTRITGLMADHQPPHNAVSQVPSDGGHTLLSNTSTQLAAPPISQLATSMPDESVIPAPTPSDSLPELPQNAPAPDDSQPAIISDVHGGAQQAGALLSQDSVKDAVTPMDSGSDYDIHSSDCGSPFTHPSPAFVPLPESDVEEDYSSESMRDDGALSTADGTHQNSDVNTTSTGEGTSPSGNPDSPNAAQPSKHSPPETPS